ncbi:hypothetical protein K458DRAFT_384149 [Lentithecium fluviatile CBS 122367]|uniref:Alpha/beta-hydrolase n=1 Tax=Lentithecium fluviatile CBS 122367 TaxID=1168545 RepID=A0A6G1JG32_9PLEO|nr:hypothetical protein K458DRAFT_384149 [Lentithecium fluviatile CBS 122367]
MQELPPKKIFTVQECPSYAYVYPTAKEKQPTFLLLHGFPSYGNTDKPAAFEEYAFSKMSSHIARILDHERTQVIGYFSALVFVSVPYSPPHPFDLGALNALTKDAVGYEKYGYMSYFNETDASDINSVLPLSLVYPDKPELHKTELCSRGKIKEWVEARKTAPLPRWESQEEREARIKLFEKGGWTGSTNWYKSVIRNIDADAESKISPTNFAITKPVIFMGGDMDYLTRPELMAHLAEQGKQEDWLPNVEFKTVTGGSHWLMLEQPGFRYFGLTC